MAYCTTSDVTGRFKGLTVGASTALTTTGLEAIIDQHSALIDSRIAKRYETPVSSAPYSLLVLKLICLYFVIPEVERIVGQAATKEGDTEKKASFGGLAEAMLAKIESGQLELTDATAVSAGSIRSGNVDNSVTATFERGTRQW